MTSKQLVSLLAFLFLAPQIIWKVEGSYSQIYIIALKLTKKHILAM
jgi:hypothetical protein